LSLRYEQYNSLKMTREFLIGLLSKKTRPKTIGALQIEAMRCLRHFPPLAETGKPIFSKDEFTKD
jgi:hypothetical protein